MRNFCNENSIIFNRGSAVHPSPLTVKRFFVVSVVGTLASVFDTSLSALFLCVRKQNIRMVVIISRKERRERGVLIYLLFTLALEMSQVSLRLENAEAGRQTNITNNCWFSASLCALLSCVASDLSNDSVI